MIRFACPSCDKTLGIDDRFSGRRIACPNCKAELTVPSTQAPESRQERSDRIAAAYAEDDGRMRLKRFGDEEDDLDMTPMVDVTFLLLIFFMITASFQLQKSLPAAPPDRTEAAAATITPEEPEDDPIIIEIGPDDVVFLDGKRLLPGDVESALMETRVRERVADLVIEADREATHGTVINVSDAAIRAGFESIKRTSVGG